MDSEPGVLFIGKSCHGEFAGALDWLRARGDVVLQPTVETALMWLQDSRCQPATIVLGLTRRGEHAARGLQQLQRTVPLANLIALVGSWCEGETRSGKPANGWSRVYWHQFPRRAAGEFFLEEQQDGSTGLRDRVYVPKTMSDNERCLLLSKRPLPRGCGRIGINTLREVDYDALANACASAGYKTFWWQRATPEMIGEADCVVWDRWGLQDRELRELLCWRERWGDLPVVATIGFPRTQDYQLVAEGVVESIVGKPFVLTELLAALQESREGPLPVSRAA
ncbi:MAG: hypothetical protein VB857_06820 [Pirellulaceae bacterium]